MPKIGILFNPYIYRLFLKIKDFSENDLRTLCTDCYRLEVTHDMYWKVFRKSPNGEAITPTNPFMSESYNMIFKHFLEIFDYYDDWEDFVSKETQRWISFGKPDEKEWYKPIDAAIEELGTKFSEKYNKDKRKTAKNLFTKVEKLEKDHEYHKAILECKICIKLNPELTAFTFKLVELLLKQLEPNHAIEELEQLEEKLVSQEYNEVFRHNLAISFLEIGSRRLDKVGNSFKAKAVEILKKLYTSQKQKIEFQLDTFLKMSCSYINALLEINQKQEAIEILKFVIDRSAGQIVRKDISLRIRFYESLLLKEPEIALEKLFLEVQESYQLAGKEEFKAEIVLNLIQHKKMDLEKIDLLKDCLEFPIMGNNYSGMEYKAMIILAELAERNKEYKLATDCYASIINDPYMDDDMKTFIVNNKLREI